MQLSVIFSALVSFVILAAASPTPRAISISKREELDKDKREKLDNKFMDYDKRELDNKFMDYEYDVDKREDLKSMSYEYGREYDVDKREDLKSMSYEYGRGQARAEELKNDWDSFEAQAEE